MGGITTTNGSGFYSFAGLAAGSYTITLSVPAGYNMSPLSNSGSNTVLKNLPFSQFVTFGIAPNPPIPASPLYNRVFVTSSTYTGDLKTAGHAIDPLVDTGLKGGDAICQSRADAAGLGGTWKAWLSDNSISAASRLIHSTVPYKLLNGATIANDWADLTDNSLINSISINENNAGVATIDVWTGTRPTGVGFGLTATNCFDWTINDSTGSGITGSTSETNIPWTAKVPVFTCDSQNRLYCFEQ